MFPANYFAPRYFTPNYFAETGSASSDTTLTFTGTPGYGQCISGIMWAYAATPTGGRLSIKDGSNIVFDIDITKAGQGYIPFDPALEATIGNTLTITLVDGGTTKKLNVFTNFLRAQ